jgi:hypothetical protein
VPTTLLSLLLHGEDRSAWRGHYGAHVWVWWTRSAWGGHYGAHVWVWWTAGPWFVKFPHW